MVTFEKIKTKQIKQRPWEFSVIDPAHSQALLQSVISYGQTQNIKVRRLHVDLEPTAQNYEIIDGQKIFNALVSLGITEVAAAVFEPMTEETALRLYVQHNCLNFERKVLVLAEYVKELSKTYPPARLAKILPYDIEEINHLIKLLDFDWANFKGEPVTGDQLGLF